MICDLTVVFRMYCSGATGMFPEDTEGYANIL